MLAFFSLFYLKINDNATYMSPSIIILISAFSRFRYQKLVLKNNLNFGEYFHAISITNICIFDSKIVVPHYPSCSVLTYNFGLPRGRGFGGWSTIYFWFKSDLSSPWNHLLNTLNQLWFQQWENCWKKMCLLLRNGSLNAKVWQNV